MRKYKEKYSIKFQRIKFQQKLHKISKSKLNYEKRCVHTCFQYNEKISVNYPHNCRQNGTR